jgi:hypothetical protein
MEIREQRTWTAYTRAERAAFRRAYCLCNEGSRMTTIPSGAIGISKTHAGAAKMGCGYRSNGVPSYGSVLQWPQTITRSRRLLLADSRSIS